MSRTAMVNPMLRLIFLTLTACSCCLLASAQQPPYDDPPPAEAPLYRVRYQPSGQADELTFPVAYTVWIPPAVETLRGVIVHQHGCGEGSCKSGQTGALDLHWQALARKHNCALLAPSYEQPNGANCQMWCDPRNGSDATFQRSLADLGAQSGHPELATVPWALWGHSGGGHWAGGMLMLHPQRIAAVWLRSGVPLFEPIEGRAIKPHTLPEAALEVPVMCNLGTKEGVTVKDGRFSGVWPANEKFFRRMRSQGALIGVAIDPLTSHECGNARYLAIPWLDACLTARLPDQPGQPLRSMPTEGAWLVPFDPGQPQASTNPLPASKFSGDPALSLWLPSETIARAWATFVADTNVPDQTAPPAPTNVQLRGNELTWQATADLESGISHFLIERDGQTLAQVPETPRKSFGRPLFQGLQYSDTPTIPLAEMRYVIQGDASDTDDGDVPNAVDRYHVRAVNTAGLVSE